MQNSDFTEIPRIETGLSGYNFKWIQQEAEIKVSGIRDSGTRFVSQIDVYYHKSALSNIEICNLDMLSSSNKSTIITNLKKLSNKEVPWDRIIHDMCVRTIKMHRASEKVYDLREQPFNPELQKFLIDPFIYKDQLNIIFGPGGTAKSTFAVFLAGLIASDIEQENLPFNCEGLNIYQSKHNVLYLDWETRIQEVLKNYWRVCPDTRIFYKKLHTPLSICIDQIKANIDEKKIDMVIIDSLALACGGEINEASVAIDFALLLRKLNTSSLVIAHTAKNAEQNKKSIYGSVFFHNCARNVWEVEKVTSGEDIVLKYSQRKNNLGKVNEPFCLEVSWSDTLIAIKRCDEPIPVGDDNVDDGSLHVRIYNLLRTAPATVRSIADTLHVDVNIARALLHRFKGNLFEQDGNKWTAVNEL